MIPAWLPVKDTASTPRSARAMHEQGHGHALAGGEQHVQLSRAAGSGSRRRPGAGGRRSSSPWRSPRPPRRRRGGGSGRCGRPRPGSGRRRRPRSRRTSGPPGPSHEATASPGLPPAHPTGPARTGPDRVTGRAQREAGQKTRRAGDAKIAALAAPAAVAGPTIRRTDHRRPSSWASAVADLRPGRLREPKKSSAADHHGPPPRPSRHHDRRRRAGPGGGRRRRRGRRLPPEPDDGAAPKPTWLEPAAMSHRHRRRPTRRPSRPTSAPSPSPSTPRAPR